MRQEVPPRRPQLLAGGVGLVCVIPVAVWLLTGFAAPTAAADWTFTPNQTVHPLAAGQHLWPDVVSGPGGFAGVTWMDDSQGEFHIFYSHTQDGGVSWSSPEVVDARTTGTASRFPHLALLPSGNVVAVWEDDRSGEFNVYLSKRDPSAGGPLWSIPQPIGFQTDLKLQDRLVTEAGLQGDIFRKDEVPRLEGTVAIQPDDVSGRCRFDRFFQGIEAFRVAPGDHCELLTWFAFQQPRNIAAEVCLPEEENGEGRIAGDFLRG